MALPVAIQVGPQIVADGTVAVPRGGRTAELVVQELHGRFYEQNYRGNVFAGGMSALTSISNATFTVATTGATATPIVGLYNPPTSGVNGVVLQAAVAAIITALQVTGGGPLVWMTALNQNALTLGSVGINRKTLVASSLLKVYGGAALTGLVGALAPVWGSAIATGAGLNLSTLQTAAGLMPPMSAGVENFDGDFIIPPGAVVGLFTAGTPVAHSAVSSIVWEEVPV